MTAIQQRLLTKKIQQFQTRNVIANITETETVKAKQKNLRKDTVIDYFNNPKLYLK